jgi:hypothetical protein
MSCLIGLLRCFPFSFVGFQPVHAGGLPSHDRDLPLANMFDSGAPSPPRSSCQCTEYSSRILDFEGRLSLMKRQAKIALDKASKSCGFMKQISTLEDKVSGLVARVMHLEECNSFLVDFIESACEQQKCKFPTDYLEIFAAMFAFLLLMNLRLPGTCLHPADENRRVAERIAALEKVSKDASSLWADPRRRSAVILLQDCDQHIGEAVDGCQRALMTMYSVMLPRDPLPGSFK